MRLVCFCDGSYCKRTNAAGWGYTVSQPPFGHAEQSGSFWAKDNNEAEVRALQEVERHLLNVGVKGTTVVVYTDSEDAKDHFSSAVLLKAGAKAVEVKHTPSHSGGANANAGANELVDFLAKNAMRKLRDSCRV